MTTEQCVTKARHAPELARGGGAVHARHDEVHDDDGVGGGGVAQAPGRLGTHLLDGLQPVLRLVALHVTSHDRTAGNGS